MADTSELIAMQAARMAALQSLTVALLASHPNRPQVERMARELAAAMQEQFLEIARTGSLPPSIAGRTADQLQVELDTLLALPQASADTRS